MKQSQHKSIMVKQNSMQKSMHLPRQDKYSKYWNMAHILPNQVDINQTEKDLEYVAIYFGDSKTEVHIIEISKQYLQKTVNELQRYSAKNILNFIKKTLILEN